METERRVKGREPGQPLGFGSGWTSCCSSEEIKTLVSHLTGMQLLTLKSKGFSKKGTEPQRHYSLGPERTIVDP